MKIKEGLMLKKLGDKYIVVAKSDSNINLTSLISFNKTGKVLFESLKEERSVSDLVEVLFKRFDVSKEKAKEDVVMFINKLKQNNLLE